jgi:hypothetical protein
MQQRSYQWVALEAVLHVYSGSAESILSKKSRDGKCQIFSFSLQCASLDKCNAHVTLDPVKWPHAAALWCGL